MKWHVVYEYKKGAWSIKAKFYVKPHWVEGTKGLLVAYVSHEMAAMPIYGKNLSEIFFSGTGGPIST